MTALVVGLAGCSVGPRYTAPKPAMEMKFSETEKMAADSASRALPGVEAVTRWWLVFHDPELNSLVDRAARDNRDLKRALSRVREARAQRGMAASRLRPEVDAAASYLRGHGSENVALPFGGGSGSNGGGGAASGGIAPPAPAPLARSSDDGSSAPRGGGGSPLGQGGLPGVTTNLYQAGFDASWEIDIFGGTRRAIEAADAGVAAAEESQREALVSLLAEVAQTYLELRGVQQRRQLAEEHVAAQRAVLRLVEAKQKNGFATDLEVAQQRAQLATTEAVVPELEAAERAAVHTIAFLLGAPMGALDAELAAGATSAALPPQVPVGVPSDLLRRRPDIRRAERELAAATAQVGVATADFFPSFSLTGAFGFDSSDAKHLGDWSSHYYSIAPGIHWPILDWGRTRARVHVENERQQQALLGYEDAVARALKDVEDALVRYDREQRHRLALAAAADASADARRLAQDRYEHGVADWLTVLETQRVRLQSEDALAQSDAALRRDLIALYKALGGGWE